MATWTNPPWCPPPEDTDRAAYQWAIHFLANGEWSPQSIVFGGPPDGVDLDALLRDWFHQRGGPAAHWRLRVTTGDDEATVLAEVEHWFEAHQPPVKPRPSKWPSSYVQYPVELE